MQEPLNLRETHSITAQTAPTELASRRTFLTQVAALGAGVAALQLAARAQTPMSPMGQDPMSGQTPTSGQMPMPGQTPGMMPAMVPGAPMPKNEMEYRMAIAPIAMLSLETSRIAVLKAVDPAVRQFATFELAEAIAVNNVLKDLMTPMPPMNAMAQDALTNAQNTPAGPDFDRDYIAKQNAAHITLRDTATNYLAAPMPRKAKVPEKHGRHLAMVNLPTFIEHVTHTSELMGRTTTT